MREIEFLISQLAGRTNARFDCPSCGGQNTFSISKVGMKVKYHCFRNMCSFRGMQSQDLSIDALKTSLEGHTEEERPFSIPDYWTRGISSEKCLRMILKTNCIKPYQEGLFNVAYDPRLNRLVYIITDAGLPVGGVGRALGGEQPKAYNYPYSAKVPFTVKNGNTVVVVEDCASAASITRIKGLSGLALQGTILKDDFIPYIVKFDKVIIALDNDATKKALEIKNKLTYYHNNVILWRLKKDIKDMSDKELEEDYGNNH